VFNFASLAKFLHTPQAHRSKYRLTAGGAVIMVPPTNQTKLEGEKAQFSCEAKALPGNVTVKWYREGVPVKEVSSLETRVTVRRDGSLIVNPVSADDSGQYTCEVTNGIGEPQTAAAYLNIECKWCTYNCLRASMQTLFTHANLRCGGAGIH
jgi:Immunoglobulin domain